MTYCTIDDINSGGFLKFDITNTSKLINGQEAPTVITNEIIPQVDSKIDDALRMYWSVPVDPTASPLATITLNRIAKWYVAAEIADRIYLQQGGSASPQAATWRKLADADLLLCQTQGSYLADAVKSADSPDNKSDLITDNLSQVTRATPPMFSMSKRF